jgi:hypothetical protein
LFDFYHVTASLKQKNRSRKRLSSQSSIISSIG